MSNYRKFTPEKQAAFLKMLRQTGNLTKSIRSVGLCTETAYNWRKRDPEFARDWQDALKASTRYKERAARQAAAECRALVRADAEKCFQRGKAGFLEALRQTGNVAAAARAVGGRPSRFHSLRQHDPAFAQAWSEALDEAIDRLEEEARRRALDGVAEPVFYQGKPVGFVRRYSDRLLTFLLRAYRPERFKDSTSIEQKGRVVFEIHTGREPPPD